jgi:hypothetical protein
LIKTIFIKNTYSNRYVLRTSDFRIIYLEYVVYDI